MKDNPHPIFQDFLASRKEAKLKTKLKDSMSSEEVEAITSEQNEIFDYSNWVLKALSLIQI